MRCLRRTGGLAQAVSPTGRGPQVEAIEGVAEGRERDRHENVVETLQLAQLRDLERVRRALTELIGRCDGGQERHCPILESLSGGEMRPTDAVK